MFLLQFALGAVALVWCGLGTFSFWSLYARPELDSADVNDPLPRAPKVSILVPARDEEKALPATLESLLKLDYPDFEVILVDDDSTDRTGLIAEDWAKRPQAAGRLRVIHNRDLPPGWRGKVHALSLASRAASGEWVLATDADVVFHPAVLRLAMRDALKRSVQLLSLAPEFILKSFWEKAVLPAFAFLLLTMFPVRLVNNPKSRLAIAAGAFILMRRQDLEGLGGYKCLRQFVNEDLRIAQTFKRNGRRIYLAFARGLLRTRMYWDEVELWEGLSRSAFEGVGFSVAKILAGVFLGLLVAAFPWVAALALILRGALVGLSSTSDLALSLAVGACVISAVVFLSIVRACHLSPLYVFTLPLATAFYSAVSLNSAWKSLFGRGIRWKGRNYRPPAL